MILNPPPLPTWSPSFGLIQNVWRLPAGGSSAERGAAHTSNVPAQVRDIKREIVTCISRIHKQKQHLKSIQKCELIQARF